MLIKYARNTLHIILFKRILKPVIFRAYTLYTVRKSFSCDFAKSKFLTVYSVLPPFLPCIWKNVKQGKY